jgi:hypothetical protein
VSEYRYAKDTKVPVNRSRDEVEKLLDKVGASSVASMRDSDSAAVAFRIAGRNYVMRLPFPADANGTGEQEKRVRWRALALLVKAKVVAIQSGISTPETEFLAHALLPTGQTLGEHLDEHPDQLTTSGRLLLPGGDA